jgi:hypothetical protein
VTLVDTHDVMTRLLITGAIPSCAAYAKHSHIGFPAGSPVYHALASSGVWVDGLRVGDLLSLKGVEISDTVDRRPYRRHP